MTATPRIKFTQIIVAGSAAAMPPGSDGSLLISSGKMETTT